jgi:hypothetical protein
VLDHFHSSPVITGYHFGFIIPFAFAIIGLIGSILIKEEQKAKQTRGQLV